jgi:ADP-ribose pyrophosphatase YjhB (NUDIX family)
MEQNKTITTVDVEVSEMLNNIRKTSYVQGSSQEFIVNLVYGSITEYLIPLRDGDNPLYGQLINEVCRLYSECDVHSRQWLDENMESNDLSIVKQPLLIFMRASKTSVVFNNTQEEIIDVLGEAFTSTINYWAPKRPKFIESFLNEMSRLYGELNEESRQVLNKTYTGGHPESESNPTNRLSYIKYLNNIRLSRLGAFAVIQHPTEPNVILGVSRGHTGGNANNYGFPGGTVDLGEGIQDAMIREVLEETGLVVEEFKPLFFDDEGVDNFLVGVFHVTKFSGEIIESSEGKVNWVKWEDVMTGSYGEFNSKLYKFYRQSVLVG